MRHTQAPYDARTRGFLGNRRTERTRRWSAGVAVGLWGLCALGACGIDAEGTGSSDGGAPSADGQPSESPGSDTGAPESDGAVGSDGAMAADGAAADGDVAADGAPDDGGGLADGSIGDDASDGTTIVDAGADAAPLPPVVTCTKTFGDGLKRLVATSVVVDAQGGMIVTGWMEGTVDFGGGPLTSTGAGDIFLVKLDNDCKHVWSKRFGDADDQAGLNVVVDAAGNIILTARYLGQVDFGLGPLNSGAVTLALLVAKFAPDGTPLWSKSYGTTGRTVASGVTTDPAGNVFLAGAFNGNVDFGGGSLPGAGIYLASLDSAGAYRWAVNPTSTGSTNTFAEAVVLVGGTLLASGIAMNTVDFGLGPITKPRIWGWVARYSTLGAVVSSNAFDDVSIQLFNGGSAGPIAAGYLDGITDLGTGPLSASTPDGGVTHPMSFVAKWKSDGSGAEWVRAIGAENPTPSASIDIGGVGAGSAVGVSASCSHADYGQGFKCMDGEESLIRYGLNGAYLKSTSHAVGPLAIAPTDQFVVAGRMGLAPEKLKLTKFAP